jgi:hypothetical protein
MLRGSSRAVETCLEQDAQSSQRRDPLAKPPEPAMSADDASVDRGSHGKQPVQQCVQTEREGAVEI